MEHNIKRLDEEINDKNKKINELDSIIQKVANSKSRFEMKIKEVLEPLQNQLKKEFENNSGLDIKQISLEYSFDTSEACEKFSEEF